MGPRRGCCSPARWAAPQKLSLRAPRREGGRSPPREADRRTRGAAGAGVGRERGLGRAREAPGAENHSCRGVTAWAGGPPGGHWRSLVLSLCAGRAAVTPCVEVGGWGRWCGEELARAGGSWEIAVTSQDGSRVVGRP